MKKQIGNINIGDLIEYYNPISKKTSKSTINGIKYSNGIMYYKTNKLDCVEENFIIRILKKGNLK